MRAQAAREQVQRLAEQLEGAREELRAAGEREAAAARAAAAAHEAARAVEARLATAEAEAATHAEQARASSEALRDHNAEVVSAQLERSAREKAEAEGARWRDAAEKSAARVRELEASAAAPAAPAARAAARGAGAAEAALARDMHRALGEMLAFGQLEVALLREVSVAPRALTPRAPHACVRLASRARDGSASRDARCGAQRIRRAAALGGMQAQGGDAGVARADGEGAGGAGGDGGNNVLSADASAAKIEEWRQVRGPTLRQPGACRGSPSPRGYDGLRRSCSQEARRSRHHLGRSTSSAPSSPSPAAPTSGPQRDRGRGRWRGGSASPGWALCGLSRAMESQYSR